MVLNHPEVKLASLMGRLLLTHYPTGAVRWHFSEAAAALLYAQSFLTEWLVPRFKIHRRCLLYLVVYRNLACLTQFSAASNFTLIHTSTCLWPFSIRLYFGQTYKSKECWLSLICWCPWSLTLPRKVRLYVLLGTRPTPPLIYHANLQCAFGRTTRGRLRWASYHRMELPYIIKLG